MRKGIFIVAIATILLSFMAGCKEHGQEVTYMGVNYEFVVENESASAGDLATIKSYMQEKGCTLGDVFIDSKLTIEELDEVAREKFDESCGKIDSDAVKELGITSVSAFVYYVERHDEDAASSKMVRLGNISIAVK